jgi:uncharacterized protein YndB with AHSA1/START domain/DNA-binding transcriptional ArsR family regulator
MDAETLAALGEPNRLRIVELLGGAPRSVGEVAETLGLRQPQATKHLQTLQRAGLVTMHPLGQRRIYALRRAPLRELRAWLAPFEADDPDEDVLARYERAIAAERERPDPAAPRAVALEAELPATPAAVWRAWTSAAAGRDWWAPPHFTVADCTVDAVAGGALRVVLAERDGARHVAEGRFLALERPRRLRFALAPLGPDGAPLFAATYDVRLRRAGTGTRLALAIDVRDARPEAAPALAGIGLGWEQLLENLSGFLAAADAP